MQPLSLPTEYSITGRSDSATASRMMWMLSASSRWRWLRAVMRARRAKWHASSRSRRHRTGGAWPSIQGVDHLPEQLEGADGGEVCEPHVEAVGPFAVQGPEVSGELRGRAHGRPHPAEAAHRGCRH